jgi:acyl carrier protein
VTGELRETVGRVLGVPAERVCDATGSAAVDPWSSLQQVQLLAALEDAHGIRFTPAEMRRADTVGALRALLRERGITA